MSASEIIPMWADTPLVVWPSRTRMIAARGGRVAGSSRASDPDYQRRCGYQAVGGKRGDETLARLVEEFGALLATLTQRTWSAGLQYVFVYVPGIRNSTS